MKKIAVIPNLFKDTDLSCTGKVLDFLCLKDCDIFISQEHLQNLSKNKPNGKIHFTNEDELYQASQLIICIGGDGTILKTSHKASPEKLPILGINLGTIGFMSELEISEIQLLDALFTSDYTVEHRMMLDVEVVRNNQVVASYTALNDAVLSKGVVSKLVEIDLFSNNTPVTYYRADGLIVATPTGSTAYSLSVGGPIIDSSLECICVTPVSPHSFMNSRPMIYSSDAHLTLKPSRERDEELFLTVDGLYNMRINYGDEIHIKKSALTTQLVRIKNTEFYDAVYKKLSERR